MGAERRAGLVSIIIPALNEQRFIGRCLEALTRLDLPEDSFEVIVVDNGSTDRTVEIARSFSPALKVTVLPMPGARISAMRNAGVSVSHGAVLAFLDADCVAPPHWLEKATSLLAREGVGVAGSRPRIPEDSRWVARAWYGGLEHEKQGDVSWVGSHNMVIARSTFARVGGFDESIQTNEDCELCERIRSAGLRVVGSAGVAVLHLGTPQTLVDFYRKIRWQARDGLRVFLRSLPRITNPRPLLFGAYTLTCIAGAAVGGAMAVWSGEFGPLTFFLSALLVPALLLSLRLAVKRRNLAIVGPLTVLHLAYGLARGHALLRASEHVRRS